MTNITVSLPLANASKIVRALQLQANAHRADACERFQADLNCPLAADYIALENACLALANDISKAATEAEGEEIHLAKLKAEEAERIAKKEAERAKREAAESQAVTQPA